MYIYKCIQATFRVHSELHMCMVLELTTYNQLGGSSLRETFSLTKQSLAVIVCSSSPKDEAF